MPRLEPPKVRILLAGLIVLGSVCLQGVLIQGRHVPTVFGDEFLYMARARNVWEHGSYFAPEGTRDEAQLAYPAYFSAPLYPVFLAPAYALGGDLVWLLARRWCRASG